MKKAIIYMLASAAIAGGALAYAASDQLQNIFVYKNGHVVHADDTQAAARVDLDAAKTGFTVLDANGNALYSAATADVDSINFDYSAPVADVLDLRFNADGTVEDVSPMKNAVEVVGNSGKVNVTYNEIYGCYSGNFKNDWGTGSLGSNPNYCKVDYKDNQAFINALKGGHTLETVFLCHYEGSIANAEAKWFASHEAGGTGLMTCKSNDSRGVEITFLPNVSKQDKSEWRWATSGVVPQPETYYHVVGVWDKEAGVARIYINGELKNTVAAEGELHLAPNEAARWFAIGCDAGPSGGQFGGDWELVTSKIYSTALTDLDVATLYKQKYYHEVVLPREVKADVLDIKFNADGTVEDVSPMKNTVEVVGNDGKVNVAYNDLYGCYSGNFINNWGTGSLGDNPNYCKVDYKDNQAFIDALKGGHTLETVFLCRYEGTIANAEAKWFASHEAGGTGLMTCKSNDSRGVEITFLPNVSQQDKSEWRWATSGVVPQPETYYHVVGVWDQEAGEARIYINGELKNTVAAEGELHLAPNEAARWFAIGCDAGPSGGQFGGNWEVVTSKIYSFALTSDEVAEIYDTNYSPEVLNPDPLRADLLDIRFNADGTAVDVSPMKMHVESHTSGISTVYNDAFGGYVCRLGNVFGSNPSGYYKVDFETNQAFRDALADGHTLEALITAKYEGTLADNDKEVKFLASHERGGTGLMLCNSGHGQVLTFLPNVSTTGGSVWRWATSKVQPQVDTYYHVIGIWDKEAQTARIYVNGELQNTVSAEGDLVFAASGNNWFGIGCDAGPTAQLGWNGDIVISRVYDRALTDEEALTLWSRVKPQIEAVVPDMVTNVSFYSGIAMKVGSKFDIFGEGFQAGDKIDVAAAADIKTILASLPANLTDKGVDVTIPAGVVSGDYRITLNRDGKKQDLGLVKLNIVSSVPAGSNVIAHRGYWNVIGGAQNSRAALKGAQELGCYGSETDIWITTDGELMVNHDASFNGVTIQNSTSTACKMLTLSNGEKMPTLNDLLTIIKESSAPTKLIIEIKEHSTAERNKAAATAAVNAVKAMNLQDKVEYISFSAVACEQVIADDPQAKVGFLSGGESPASLHAKGYTGLNYNIAEYRSHPEWVAQAHNLNMECTAWTINSAADIAEMMNLEMDNVTTDIPAEAIAIKALYDKNADK